MKIIYEIDNDCVGCPQGCIHCGRGDYTAPIAIECDMCGEQVDEVYRTDDGYICKKCVLDLEKITVEDIADNLADYADDEWVKAKKERRNE